MHLLINRSCVLSNTLFYIAVSLGLVREPTVAVAAFPSAAMTLFYVAVSLGLVNVWMAWRRFLWADKFFMQAGVGEACGNVHGVTRMLACWRARGPACVCACMLEVRCGPVSLLCTPYPPFRCGPLVSPPPGWPGRRCCTT